MWPRLRRYAPGASVTRHLVGGQMAKVFAGVNGRRRDGPPARGEAPFTAPSSTMLTVVGATELDMVICFRISPCSGGLARGTRWFNSS